MSWPRKHKNAPIHGDSVKQVLVALGEDEKVACVMAALLEAPAMMPKLEDRTWYSHQPVTAAFKELRARGWLKSEDVPSEARGRNPQKYSIAASKTALRKHYKAAFDTRLGLIELRL